MTITGWLPETLFIALPAAGLGIGFVLGRWDAAYSGYGVLDGALAETAVMVAEWEAIHHQADESYPRELSGAREAASVNQDGPPSPGSADEAGTLTGELFLADQLAQAEDFRQWIDDWPPIEDVQAELFPKGDKSGYDRGNTDGGP